MNYQHWILRFVIVVIVGLILLASKTRIKTKWNIESDRDYWLIMIAYSLAGMFILPVKKVIFHAVGITDHTPFWIVVLVYIPLIPPVYQIGLIFFGTLLGQFNFVWGQAKKRFQFLSRPFRRA
jgi:hypothetical protein